MFGRENCYFDHGGLWGISSVRLNKRLPSGIFLQRVDQRCVQEDDFFHQLVIFVHSVTDRTNAKAFAKGYHMT